MPANIVARAASKLSFAHLTRASKKVEDKDDNKDKAEDEDDEPQDQNTDDGDAKSASDDDSDDKEDKKSRKAKKAKDDEDDADAEDDDDDEEMRGKNAVASARRRERARCAAIFAYPAAARDIGLACSLAFETDLPREQAIAVLSKSSAKSTPNAARAARNPNIGAGGRLEANSAQAIASSWDWHMKKVQSKPQR